MAVTKKTSRTLTSASATKPKIITTQRPIDAKLVASTDMDAQLSRIAASQRTAFEKRVWTALCQIPQGSVTTYGLLAAHLGTSARAVGNALRRNPFAPEVPCHRVVATGGALGGFKGRWPRDGEGITITEKRTLLRGEGVRFDAEGAKVLGTPWAGWAKVKREADVPLTRPSIS
jgi:methylated-DNA-[protein]-cysteine S-methyltransferase